MSVPCHAIPLCSAAPPGSGAAAGTRRLGLAGLLIRSRLTAAHPSGELGESRAAQSAGVIGFEHRGALFTGETESPPAVGFDNDVVRFGHSSSNYDRDARRTPQRSYGATDHAYPKPSGCPKSTPCSCSPTGVTTPVMKPNNPSSSPTRNPKDKVPPAA